MILRNGLAVIAVLTFVRNALHSNGVIDVIDVIQVASCVGVLVLIDSAKYKGRVKAIEAYLTNLKPLPSGDRDAVEPSLAAGESAECEALLRQHLNAIVGERHPKTSPQHHEDVRNYIVEQVRKTGWDARLQPVKGPHGTGYNVIADPRGGCDADDRGLFVVGAHYDSVSGTPGANDNGIAVAGLLALAELLKSRDQKHRIRLVAWDLEERQGVTSRAFRGSAEMVRQIKKTDESILGVICLEMIGCCSHAEGSQQLPRGLRWAAPDAFRSVRARQHRGDFIAVAANSLAKPLASYFVAAAQERGLPAIPLWNRGLLRLSGSLRRSDHVPFWDAGIPALMLTDTADMRAPFYHTPMDRQEVIDFQFAARVVLATADCCKKHARR